VALKVDVEVSHDRIDLARGITCNCEHKQDLCCDCGNETFDALVVRLAVERLAIERENFVIV
jgi:hypothetical protein